MKTPTPLLLCSFVLLAACAGEPQDPAAPASPPAAAGQAAGAESLAPADAFMARLAEHCGQAFAGRIVTDVPPAEGEDPFAGKALVMHVRECSADELKVPFHVGDDHSRTWVITRTDTGLRLKHDHRHADGSPDAVTLYGGDTDGAGTAVRQSFPVDAESVEMFGREGLKASIQNTWAMEIEPGQRFLYELSRPGGRLFQVEFDLSQPVDTPPAPWGHEDSDPAGS